MEIKKGENMFYVGDSEDSVKAKMTYVPSGENIIIIDGTFVSSELRGQGVGKKLLKEIVDWCRKENKKIVPLCPYAKAQIEKNNEYHDMIHK